MRPLPSSRAILRAVELGRSAGARRAVRSFAVPAAAHLAPSVLLLGQFWPERVPALRALPAGLCRWRGPDTGRPEVALTFDDGPDPDSTPRVLDLLDEGAMRATFFLTGERVDENRDLVREIHRRGHEIGTHGYSHAHHLLRTANQIVADLERAITSLERIGPDFRPRHFRPPYGQVSGGSIVAAHRLHLDMVLWSAWGREWADHSPASVAARIERRLEPGAIILLHDSDSTSPPGSAAVALEALALVTDEIAARQMTSVRIIDLLRRTPILVTGTPSRLASGAEEP